MLREDALDEVLIQTNEGRVSVLTLSRPDTLNALDSKLMRRFEEAVRRVAHDDAVGCVVITGAGRGFCSGGDTKAIAAAAVAREDGSAPPKSTFEARVRWLRRSVEASRLLHEMGKPTIAMINGACAGAGMSIAGACDLRFAGRSATFVSAFTKNGVPGDYGGSWFWTQILGTAKARELYLLGEKMDAAEALAFGLVHRVHDDDALREATMKIAHRMAALPPTGLAYAKENLNAATTDGLAALLDRESLNMTLGRHALIEANKASKAGS